jgi:hypothetical protein
MHYYIVIKAVRRPIDVGLDCAHHRYWPHLRRALAGKPAYIRSLHRSKNLLTEPIPSFVQARNGNSLGQRSNPCKWIFGCSRRTWLLRPGRVNGPQAQQQHRRDDQLTCHTLLLSIKNHPRAASARWPYNSRYTGNALAAQSSMRRPVATCRVSPLRSSSCPTLYCDG